MPGMRTRLVLSLAVLLVLAVATVAFAAIPHSTTGAITGCYSNSTGSLKVIDAQAGATCAGNETTLTWLQSGVTGFERVQAVDNSSQWPSGTGFALEAQCPTGKAVFSGGYLKAHADTDVTQSYPDITRRSWTITFANLSGSTHTGVGTAYALCAQVNP
jgi:hypothetical protein